MKNAKVNKILVLCLVWGMTFGLYLRSYSADQPRMADGAIRTYLPSPHRQEPANKKSYFILEWLEESAYSSNIDQQKEKDVLRKKWEDLIGVDIFYPYFKAKEVEKVVGDATKIQVFDMTGKTEIKKGRVQYIFKRKF